MTDQDLYLLFSEQFRTIDDNLDDLVNQAEDFVQANRIIDSWKQANLNYLKARNKIFSSHEAAIGDLVTQFQQAQDAIKKSLDDLKNQATTIGNVSRVIAFGVSQGKALQEAV